MSEFSDRPFVAGSLVGLRAFDVDSLGRLTGVAYADVFKPGENVAKCHDNGMTAMTRSLERSLSHMTWRINHAAAQVEALPQTSPKVPKHVLAGVDCACGYYAYFDGTNARATPSTVSAVVEGYGVCTVGDRGFRAEKARLVGLVLPKARRFFGTWKVNAFWVAVLAPFAVANTIRGNWLAVAIECALVLAHVGTGVFRLYVAKKWQPTRGRADLIRRAYPDVPTYSTVRAALRAHPLTPPPPPKAPTPADDDFWTRPVVTR